MTEEIQRGINSEPDINIADLNADVHHIIKKTVDAVCMKPMEMLGYPLTTEIQSTGEYLKPYTRFWEFA